VYLLHGAGADETQWPAIGLAARADELIAAHSIRRVIVVMPDSGLAPDDTSLVDTIVPWADANLPASTARTDRAIGGISAGGTAAIRITARNRNLFSRLGGHSAVVDAGTADLAPLAAWDGAVWLDVGEDDGLRPGTEAAARTLTALGARSELHVWPGQHDRAYWGAHVTDYLLFYAGQ